MDAIEPFYSELRINGHMTNRELDQRKLAGIEILAAFLSIITGLPIRLTTIAPGRKVR